MLSVAIHSVDEKGQHNLKILKENISQEEYDDFFSYFDFFEQYHQLKALHDICLMEIQDLNHFLHKNNLNRLLRNQNIDANRVLIIGNKLLINYCTIIKMLVEKIESYLKHNHPENSNDFENLTHKFYDQHFSYRFFMRLRNFVIHNGLPFTIVDCNSDDDCNIFMDKSNLLKSKGWSKVKHDIEKIKGNKIAVQPLLEDVGGLIYAIYLQGLYYLTPEVIKAIKNIEKYIKKYDYKRFEFVEYDSVDSLKNGQIKIRLVPWSDYYECIKELNKHPNININLDSKKDDKQ